MALTDQNDCFIAIRDAFKRFGQDTGQSVPYIVKNYLRKYNQQISPSTVTAKISASLGYHAFINKTVTGKDDGSGQVIPSTTIAENITGNFDVAKNPTNAAIVLNSFFASHCRRLSLCNGTPSVFFVSKEEEDANEKKFRMNSRHLAVCHYLGTTNDSAAVQFSNVGKIENTFTIASNASARLRTAIRNAIEKRTGTSPIEYDIFISTDEKGKNKMVWYNMARLEGWRSKSVYITANVLTNWIHKNIPDEKSSRMTPEILSSILRCPIEESTAILKSSISSQQEFESLNEEKPSGVCSPTNIAGMEISQSGAETIADLKGSEVDQEELTVGGADLAAETEEPDDAGIEDEIVAEKEEKKEKAKPKSKKKKKKKSIDNSVTDIANPEAVGVSDNVSEEVSIIPPKSDPTVLEDEKTSTPAEIGEGEESDVLPQVVGDDVSLAKEDFGQQEDSSEAFKDVPTGAFSTPGEKGLPSQPEAVSEPVPESVTAPPEVQIEEPAVPVEKTQPSVTPADDYTVVKSPEAVPSVSPVVSPASVGPKSGPKAGKKRLPPKKQNSLLGLVRVAKSLIRKGDFKKAEAINNQKQNPKKIMPRY